MRSAPGAIYASQNQYKNLTEHCAARSEFFLRVEPEHSEGGGARRLKTASAWPRAAQHNY